MIDKGGPAFPQIELHQVTGHPFAQHFGMTLRDYFAAKAMHALFQNTHFDRANGFQQKKTAAIAYQMADAMLKAREA